MSKTFENYIRARERAENIAKDKIDQLNKYAMTKFYNSKKAQSSQKDNFKEKRAAIEEHNNKIKACLEKKELDHNKYMEEARDYQEILEKQILERQEQKKAHEKQVSEEHFRQAQLRYTNTIN